jgi:hypothetical protein
MDAPTPTQMDCWTCQARSWWDSQAQACAAPNDIAPPSAVAVVAPEADPVVAEEPVTPVVEVKAEVVVIAEEIASPMPDDRAAFAADPVVATPVAVAVSPTEVIEPMPDGSAAFVAELVENPPVEPAPAIDEILAPMPNDVAVFASEPVGTMPRGIDAFVSEPATEEFVEIVEISSDSADLEAFFAELAADPLAVLYPALDHEMIVEEPPVPVVRAESRIEILDDEPAAAEAVIAAPKKDAKLTEAVRLTRQALRAWVGVLNAPAVVSASR